MTAKNRVKAGAAGGIEAITEILRRYKGSSNTTEASLDVLLSLKEDPESSAKIKRLLSEDPSFKEYYPKLYYSGLFNLWGWLW